MQEKIIQSDLIIKYPYLKKDETIKLESIIVNVNHNNALQEKLELFNLLDFFQQLCLNITPILLLAKSPISNFKRRKGMPIG